MIKPSRSKARQKDRASIWGKLDLAGTGREIVEQDTNDSSSGEKLPQLDHKES